MWNSIVQTSVYISFFLPIIFWTIWHIGYNFNKISCLWINIIIILRSNYFIMDIFRSEAEIKPESYPKLFRTFILNLKIILLICWICITQSICVRLNSPLHALNIFIFISILEIYIQDITESRFVYFSLLEKIDMS